MRIHVCALAAAALSVAACGGDRPISALAEAEAAVAEAERADAAAYAPLEMRAARENLTAANLEAEDGDEDNARDLAQRATADANAALAVASQARATQAETALAVTQAENTELRAELQGEQTSRGYVVSLGDVLFETDQAQLTPAGLERILGISDYLRANPGQAVVIEGHADSRGSPAYNQQLSEARAQAVTNALLAQGVATPRIIYSGAGEMSPIASNATATGRQMNRRVDVIFVDRG